MFKKKVIQNKVYLPEALREAMHIKNGDEIMLQFKDEPIRCIIITKPVVNLRIRIVGDDLTDD